MEENFGRETVQQDKITIVLDPQMTLLFAMLSTVHQVFQVYSLEVTWAYNIINFYKR